MVIQKSTKIKIHKNKNPQKFCYISLYGNTAQPYNYAHLSAVHQDIKHTCNTSDTPIVQPMNTII